MKERDILIGLHHCPGIGWKSIEKLVQAGTLQEMNPLIDGERLKQLQLSEELALPLRSALRTDRLVQIKESFRVKGISILTILDKAYPETLKQIAQPPWVLYGKGELGLLQNPSIAIVGTRAPTVYGKRTAYELAEQLSESGFTVVSGLARGIDSEAHRGALTAVGSTIAVLGSGIDVIYPAEHSALYNKIAEKGLLLSEFPLGKQPHPGFFPMRNRIIAGISLGTVVVEAAARSGSLITSDFAIQESRDVFAVPGQIHAPKSQGPLELIKQGAKLVTSAQDIIEEYALRLTPSGPDRGRNPAAAIEMNEDEQRIYALLEEEPQSFERILLQSGIEFGHLHAVLLSLLMKNMIEQHPGSMYAIIYRS